MTRTTHPFDVIIAGGGPVGMLLSTELALHGVRTLVLEPNPRTLDQPKAGTLHARTVQSLTRRGHLPLPSACRVDRTVTSAFHFAGMPGLSITAPAVEGPPIVGRTQAGLERLFEKRARGLGVEVWREHAFTGLVQEEDGVTVTATGPDGRSVRLRTGWVVGADGARSAVRRAAGFESDEYPATLRALLGEVRLDDPYAAPPGWQRTERGWTVINVNPGGPSRVITFEFTGPDPDRHAPLTLQELHDTASGIAGHDIPMSELTFSSRFSDYSRLVRQYRSGRVLLAGDAAHVHFPVGGQGLNLGLQDAFNLGWKLAAVVREQAHEELLDTYHAERHPAGRGVVDNTRAQRDLMRPGPEAEPLRTLVRGMLRSPEASRHLGDMISAQDILAGTGMSGCRGEFLPNLPLRREGVDTCVAELLYAGRPVLLVPSAGAPALEAVAAERDGVLDVVRADSADGAVDLSTSALLLRPDGYLAWTGTVEAVGEASLRRTLNRLLGTPLGGAREPVAASVSGE
ncbi:FAD-dependent monooxygenase [Streptomyces sp. NPDC001904]|uniref:FAD-dependent monooxygenase n=1 Tax=Streptomyces sp. NPDC001904 TaxID=3154531 RepID=UPI00332A0980